jgi:hypothetical protein
MVRFRAVSTTLRWRETWQLGSESWELALSHRGPSDLARRGPRGGRRAAGRDWERGGPAQPWRPPGPESRTCWGSCNAQRECGRRAGPGSFGTCRDAGPLRAVRQVLSRLSTMRATGSKDNQAPHRDRQCRTWHSGQDKLTSRRHVCVRSTNYAWCSGYNQKRICSKVQGDRMRGQT